MPEQIRPIENNADEIEAKRCPVGWFDVQLQFADAWSRVTGMPIAEARQTRTSLARLIPPQAITDTATATELYARFARWPDSDYAPSHRFGAFDYNYNPDNQCVKVHFENPQRGSNPLSIENMPTRQTEFRALLTAVQDEHPTARTVMSASWLRSVKSYQRLFPPNLAEPQDLMAPNMSFGVNYVWGQFINRNGATNTRLAEQFTVGLAEAKTTEQLIAAFPLKALLVNDPIEQYYDHYEI